MGVSGPEVPPNRPESTIRRVLPGLPANLRFRTSKRAVGRIRPRSAPESTRISHSEVLTGPACEFAISVTNLSDRPPSSHKSIRQTTVWSQIYQTQRLTAEPDAHPIAVRKRSAFSILALTELWTCFSKLPRRFPYIFKLASTIIIFHSLDVFPTCFCPKRAFL